MRSYLHLSSIVVITLALCCGACKDDDTGGIPEDQLLEFLVIDTTDVNPFVTIVETDIEVIAPGGRATVNARLEEYEFFLDVSTYFIAYWSAGITDEETRIFNTRNGLAIHSAESIDTIVTYTTYDDELEVDCYHRKNYYTGLDLADAENIEFEIFQSNLPFVLSLGDTLYANSAFQSEGNYILVDGYWQSFYSDIEGFEGCSSINDLLGRWNSSETRPVRYFGFKFTDREVTYLGWVELIVSGGQFRIEKLGFAPVAG